MISTNQNSFWLAWINGKDLPYCYTEFAQAKAKTIELAKGAPDKVAYLMKAEVIGSCIQPSESMITDGAMKQ